MYNFDVLYFMASLLADISGPTTMTATTRADMIPAAFYNPTTAVFQMEKDAANTGEISPLRTKSLCARINRLLINYPCRVADILDFRDYWEIYVKFM